MNLAKCTLAGLVILICGMFSQPVLAQNSSGTLPASDIIYGFRLGLLAHDVGWLWSHSRAEDGMDGNAEIVFKKPSLKLWEGIVLPNLGVTINSEGDTSKIYGGLLWEFLFKNGLFVNSGVGLALHNGRLESNEDDEKELGARVLFRVPLEVGCTLWERHRISIMFDHISNAYLASPNEGLDTLGVRYGYQF